MKVGTYNLVNKINILHKADSIQHIADTGILVYDEVIKTTKEL